MNRSEARWLCGAVTALVLTACNSSAPVADRTNGSTGSTPSLNDFPEAPQALVFTGHFAAQVSIGQPTSCGYAIGPSGPLYGYTVGFEAGDGHSEFTVLTNPRVEPYKGPGLYHAHASLSTVVPNGPRTVYEGDLKFVVTQDPLTGRLQGGVKSPNTGAVDGALKDTLGRTVSVSGGWTCVPSMFTGPG
jgi:hypothetical protein